ncbi:MAG: DUF4442 domain-containing protein [Zetaproteobacteria bacterium]|nr:DUF4442 domain-containing protein [Zetaproteobacteria bacterium]
MQQVLATLGFRWWALCKVPMLFLLRPWVTTHSTQKVSVRIPLGWLQRNHLNSMYVAVMIAGADAAAGLLTDAICRQNHSKAIGLSFKEFNCKFNRRATAATEFTCTDTKLLQKAFKEAIRTGERQNQKVKVIATYTDKGQLLECARFTIVVSFRAAAIRS